MITFPTTVLVSSNGSATAGGKGFLGVYSVNNPQSAATVAPATLKTEGQFVVGLDTGRTKSYTTPTGTTASIQVRKFSRPIILNKVKEVAANNYAAPSLQQTTVTYSSSFVPIAGEEYVLRLIYKDVVGHPGQFTHSYRYTTTTNSQADIFNGLVKQINNSQNARVTASYSSSTLTLTAKEVDDNVGVDTVNSYSYVNFTAVFYEADSLGNSPVTGVTIKTTVGPDAGIGYWKTVRDREKWALGYAGIFNYIDYFGPKPELFVEEGVTYDQIVIKSSQPYHSPDNNYDKETDVMTEIYVQDGGQSAFWTGLNTLLGNVAKTFNSSGVYTATQSPSGAVGTGSPK
jgi:hypothetical protein